MSTKKQRRTYHHGNLKEAIVSASIEMIAEGGEDAVNMREAARRAGVSSGAPFRHFETKQKLLAAVAEEAARRLIAAMDKAGAEAGADDALERFRAMGVAYVEWAALHPALFRVLHTPSHLGANTSEAILAMTRTQRDTIAVLLRTARKRGDAHDGDALVTLTAQALVYGLARLMVDGVLDVSLDAATARSLANAATGVLGRGIAAKHEPPKSKRRSPSSDPRARRARDRLAP
jgi:AcrR family transcriptional regulator